MEKIIQNYLKRTRQNQKHIYEGYYHFGMTAVNEWILQAEKDKTKLVFYYETEDDLKADKLSYRFDKSKAKKIF